MSRAARLLNIKLIAALVVVLALAGGGVWAYSATRPRAVTTQNAAHHLTQLSYPGQSGKSAMTLLKKYAHVQIKHYSFGDFVTSIDGTAGNGPKYWTLYVNNKQATTGADAYITKNTDTVTWKLQ